MNIYVGNLPFSFDNGQLSALFAEFGEVTSAQVITDRDTGRSRGFGFVEMDDEGARKAIAELADRDIEGRRITVNQAKPREQRGGGGRGGYGSDRRSSGGNRW